MEYNFRRPEYNQARGSVGNFICDTFEKMGDILYSEKNNYFVKFVDLVGDSAREFKRGLSRAFSAFNFDYSNPFKRKSVEDKFPEIPLESKGRVPLEIEDTRRKRD
jgi:hypothetical protein